MVRYDTWAFDFVTIGEQAGVELTEIEQLDDVMVRPFTLRWADGDGPGVAIDRGSDVRTAAAHVGTIWVKRDELERKAEEAVSSAASAEVVAKYRRDAELANAGKPSVLYAPVKIVVKSSFSEDALQQAALLTSFGNPLIPPAELPEIMRTGTILATDCGGGSGSGGGMYWVDKYYVLAAHSATDVWACSVSGNDHRGQEPVTVHRSTLEKVTRQAATTEWGRNLLESALRLRNMPPPDWEAVDVQ